jgi:hypothetical protein
MFSHANSIRSLSFRVATYTKHQFSFIETVHGGNHMHEIRSTTFLVLLHFRLGRRRCSRDCVRHQYDSVPGEEESEDSQYIIRAALAWSGLKSCL